MNTSRAEANLLNSHRVQLCVLSAAMLLMGACFGGSDATATPTATPTTDAPSPAATASATAEPSTTTPAPTATAVPTAEPMPPGVGEYGVARVRKGDPDGGLNMRAEPSANAEVVLVIPPNRTGLVATGSDPVIVDDATWIELSVGSSSGWVNSTFVTPLPSFEEISCSDPTSDYSLSPGAVPPVPAPVDPDADHVFAMHHIVGPDCERTIITFGRDFGYDDNFNEVLDPSAGVPPDIALAIDLAVIRVRLPESVIAGASTATELYRSDNGSVDVLFVRPAVRSTFGIRALWDRNRGVRYFYLENPGRLVIETIDAPTGPGLALGPLFGDEEFPFTMISRSVNWDTTGADPVPPITVSGFGRPFEATASIRLRTAPASGAPPGTGTPVTAEWSGSSFAAPCGSSYAVMTNGWLEAWGAYEFTIRALASGTYELFVGDFVGLEGDDAVGVYHVFTVGGSTSASC